MMKLIAFIIFITIALCLSFCFAEETKLPDDISSHIYLVMEVSKKNIYVNEEVPIKVMLFSDWLDIENISFKQKASKDLIVRKFSDRIISNVVKDGVKYIVLEYKSALVVVVPGRYMLNPVEATMEVAMPAKNASAAASLLNENKGFYEKFIGPSGSREITLGTQPFVFNASEAPVKEKPKVQEKITMVPLKTSYGPLGRYNMRFYRNKIFLPLIVIPILAVLAAYIIKRRLNFLDANPRYAAMLRASKKARTRISRCEESMKQGRCGEFYNTIFNIMQSYLGERAIIPEEGVTAKVLEKMEGFGLGRDLCEKVEKIFSDCYMAKYAPAGFGGDDMKKTLEEVKYAIDELDKK